MLVERRVRVTAHLLLMSATRLEPALPRDGAAIRCLLEGASLPVEDLATSPIRMWLARDGTRVVGAAGLERHGDAALLRSLVVESSARDRGLGRRLVAALEDDARAEGITTLVLLTQTAKSFFEQLGYRVVDRASQPGAIQRSAEFVALCPTSAACMSKTLI